jgi:hypothetical protein
MKQPLRSPKTWKHAGFIDGPFLIIAVASATTGPPVWSLEAILLFWLMLWKGSMLWVPEGFWGGVLHEDLSEPSQRACNSNTIAVFHWFKRMFCSSRRHRNLCISVYKQLLISINFLPSYKMLCYQPFPEQSILLCKAHPSIQIQRKGIIYARHAEINSEY